MDDYGNSCMNDVGWYASFGTTYAYDAVGNRTDSSGAYGTGNRITAFANCTYGTDAVGDVTSRSCSGQNVTFWWSAESRLDSVNASGLRIAFKYDAGGRLVRKDTSGVAQRYFLWDGPNLLAELGGAATTKIGEYSYYGTDRLQAMILGTTPYHAHQDVLGNTIALTDSVLRRSYGYNAWGSLISGSDGLPFSGADRARWKGALWLGPELDLYYMRRRWYEPKTGRFLSEDPLRLAGGVNPYAYAANDPVGGADPTGAQMLPPTITLAAQMCPLQTTGFLGAVGLTAGFVVGFALLAGPASAPFWPVLSAQEQVWAFTGLGLGSLGSLFGAQYMYNQLRDCMRGGGGGGGRDTTVTGHHARTN